MADIITTLNSPVDPATFVPGKTMLASGSGHWTHGLPPNSAMAISDPGQEGLFPNVEFALDMKTLGTSTMTFMGPVAPTPPDSIGYTAKFEFAFVNDTGTTLPGILLTLAANDPKLPQSLVPGVIEFGHTVNANYPYWTDIQPGSFAGETVAMFSPDGKPTTDAATGAAASSIALNGPIAPGKTITGSVVVHNTELSTGNNDFTMMITPI